MFSLIISFSFCYPLKSKRNRLCQWRRIHSSVGTLRRQSRRHSRRVDFRSPVHARYALIQPPYGDLAIGCKLYISANASIPLTNEAVAWHGSFVRRIREEYLSNTTVTIVLIGECTKARKYVAWEIASSLRNDPVNGRSGLLGINMKSVGSRGLAPPRLYDNYDSKDKAGSYALYQTYPSTAQALRNAIQMALDRGETQKPVNTRALFKYNRPCP